MNIEDIKFPDPVAYRTFDGEDGYEFRAYENNETYLIDWNRRNPRHIGWVDELYSKDDVIALLQAAAEQIHKARSTE